MADLQVDNIFIPAFDYNSEQPRFYSKHFLRQDPAKYDLKLWEIAAATSAAPVYFNPFTYVDGYNITEYLIDGAVIANDPAFLAYETAKSLDNERNITILSIGTGIFP